MERSKAAMIPEPMTPSQHASAASRAAVSLARRVSPSSAGSTLLEAVIMAVVLMLLLQAITSSTMVASRNSDYGRSKARVLAQGQIALEKMTHELEMSSASPDPATGTPFAVVNTVDGIPQLTFRRVVEFGANEGDEVERVWSTSIVYHVTDGVLLRTQDAEDDVLLRGVSGHDFEIDQLGRIRVELRMDVPESGAASQTVTHEALIHPKF